MIDRAEYRRLMGSWATGVSVVTAFGAEGPYGATLNAFSSVSLDPALLLVCFDHSARTLGAIRHAARHPGHRRELQIGGSEDGSTEGVPSRGRQRHAVGEGDLGAVDVAPQSMGVRRDAVRQHLE